MSEKPSACQPRTGARGRAYKEAGAADFLGVSAATMPTWRSRGRGPRFVRLGRSIRYYEADLEAFLAEHTVDPGGDE